MAAGNKSEEVLRFEKEHLQLLSEKHPDKFEILHCCAVAELKRIG